MTQPLVFISYSHDSPEHVDRVLALADQLRRDGIDCVLDQYETAPPEGWTRWMDRCIRDADIVPVVCTETYYRRADSADICGRIRERLVEHLGDEAVFKDVDDIPFGADFPRHIESILAQCAAMLVVIGPDWLEITDNWAPTEHQEEDKCRIALLS